MLLEGDYTNKPVPAYFDCIKSLGEEDGNRISILTNGKNLWNDENIMVQSQNNSVIEKTQFGFKMIRKLLNNDHFGGVATLKLKPNTQYTISLNKKFSKNGLRSTLYIYSDRLFGDMLSSGIEPLTFTTKTNEFAIIGFYYIDENWDINDFVEYDNIQIEEGIKTPYEPYQQDKKDILLPFTGGARGIPDGGYDILCPNGDILKKIANTTFDSTLRLNRIHAPLGTLDKYASFVMDFRDRKLTSKPIICDKLPYIDAGFDVLTNNVSTHSTQTGIYFTIAQTELSTPIVTGMPLAEAERIFKEWMSKKGNFEIYYELNEPIIHKAQTPTNNNPATFKDITHISCLNKIAPSSMLAKFPVDTAATFSRLNRENKSLESRNLQLENEINNLTEELPSLINRQIKNFYLTKDFKN